MHRGLPSFTGESGSDPQMHRGLPSFKGPSNSIPLRFSVPDGVQVWLSTGELLHRLIEAKTGAKLRPRPNPSPHECSPNLIWLMSD
jgi:hypothetical protein